MRRIALQKCTRGQKKILISGIISSYLYMWQNTLLKRSTVFLKYFAVWPLWFKPVWIWFKFFTDSPVLTYILSLQCQRTMPDLQTPRMVLQGWYIGVQSMYGVMRISTVTIKHTKKFKIWHSRNTKQ